VGGKSVILSVLPHCSLFNYLLAFVSSLDIVDTWPRVWHRVSEGVSCHIRVCHCVPEGVALHIGIPSLAFLPKDLGLQE
jgi:hypothetical protein